jgi:hypothetical protein
MVNRTLSNLGVRLDNLERKPLKNKEHKLRMVSPLGFEPRTP